MTIKKKKIIFKCPEYLDIYNTENYEKTLQFINSLERVIKESLPEITISFMRTKDVKAAALVLLYAKLEVLIKCCDVKIHLLCGINPRLSQRLKEEGFFNLCKLKNSSNNFSGPQLPIISGKSGEFRDKIVDFIKEQIYQNQFDDNLEYVYGDAIQEAINNVSLHAYTDQKDNEKHWWLNCSLIDDELYLVLYDQGRGIPVTFTKGNKAFDEVDWDDPDLQNEVKKLITKWGLELPLISKETVENTKNSDSSSIFFAMSDDITRMIGSDELKHGQGSKSIKKLVSSHEKGILWIFSNKGLYRYENDDKAPFLKDYINSIQGTLIQWNIKVFR